MAKPDLLLQHVATMKLPEACHRGIWPGGASEPRPRDPLLAKQVLFQLSYSPFACRRPVRVGVWQLVRPRCRTTRMSLPAVSDSAPGSADPPPRDPSRQTEYRVCWHAPAPPLHPPSAVPTPGLAARASSSGRVGDRG